MWQLWLKQVWEDATAGKGREALRLGWVLQNESPSGICCNENSAVGLTPLLRQSFPWGEPQEWPSLMQKTTIEPFSRCHACYIKKKPQFKRTRWSVPTPSQAAKKYQKELETQLWKQVLAKDSPPSQDRRGDRREAGDRPYAWSNICSSAKLSEDLGHQFH